MKGDDKVTLVNVMTSLRCVRESVAFPLHMAPDSQERKKIAEAILHLDKALAHLSYLSVVT